MRNVSAAGYESLVGSIYSAPKLAMKIVRQYNQCALTPRIARSNFLNDDELFCGGKVIYGVEQELDFFGVDTDNNEDPDTFSGSPTSSASLVICQERKMEWKISNSDKRRLCSNFSVWETDLRRQININLTKLVDAYTVPKVLASAHPDNVGSNAGKISHNVDLGNQSGGALLVNSAETFEALLNRLILVFREAGVMCGEGEIADMGDYAKPVLLIPYWMEQYARSFLLKNQVACCNNGVLYSGRIGEIFGLEIISTRWLVPQNFGASGILTNVALIDPMQVLHAFDMITNKWHEGKYEDFLISQFVWDTFVFNQHGVAVATTRQS